MSINKFISDTFISTSDFFKLIRLNNLFIIVLTMILGRVFLIGPKEEWMNIFHEVQFWLLILATVLIAAAGYIINDYYDIKIDTVNKPDEVVVGRIMKRRVAMLTHTFFNLSAIAIGLMISKYIALINFIVAFWLWLYSNQLKRMVLIGNISIAFMTALTLLVLNVFYQQHNFYIYIFALFSFFISIIREVIKDIEDRKGDAKFGCRTLPIVWGIRKTKIFLFFMVGSFVTFTWLLLLRIEHQNLTYFFIAMLVPTIHYSYKLYRADTTKAFHDLSQYSKLIMVFGVMAMTLV